MCEGLGVKMLASSRNREKFTIFGVILREQERQCQRETWPDHDGSHSPRRGTGLPGPDSSEESWEGPHC